MFNSDAMRLEIEEAIHDIKRALGDLNPPKRRGIISGLLATQSLPEPRRVLAYRRANLPKARLRQERDFDVPRISRRASSTLLQA
jgi:hypothetical protein